MWEEHLATNQKVGSSTFSGCATFPLQTHVFEIQPFIHCGVFGFVVPFDGRNRSAMKFAFERIRWLVYCGEAGMAIRRPS